MLRYGLRPTQRPAPRAHRRAFLAGVRAVIDTIAMALFSSRTKTSATCLDQSRARCLDRDGCIVNNYHLIGDAPELAVALADGTVRPTRVVAADAESGIRAVRDRRQGLRPIVTMDGARNGRRANVDVQLAARPASHAALSEATTRARLDLCVLGEPSGALTRRCATSARAAQDRGKSRVCLTI